MLEARSLKNNTKGPATHHLILMLTLKVSNEDQKICMRHLGDLWVFGTNEKRLVLANLFFFALTDIGLIAIYFPELQKLNRILCTSINDLITLYAEL